MSSVFITGGNSGIGLATAKKFAEEKVNVVIFSVKHSDDVAIKAEIESLGVKCLLLYGDVSKEDDIKRALSKTIEEFGSLEFAFNNAGIEEIPADLKDKTEADYDKIMDTNVKGVWLCMKNQIPLMLKTGGAIVNTSSIAGLVGFEGIPLYDATKHAVIGLTKTLAIQYAKYGIRINAVCPGVIQTPMIDRFIANNPAIEKTFKDIHPIGRIGMAEEVAEAVFWLCSKKASFIVGQALAVDGGMTSK